MNKSTSVDIQTHGDHGDDFCGEDCPHSEQVTKFPAQIACKITGQIMEPDQQLRVRRPNECKYLFDEEVPDQFWHPLKR